MARRVRPHGQPVVGREPHGLDDVGLRLREHGDVGVVRDERAVRGDGLRGGRAAVGQVAAREDASRDAVRSAATSVGENVVEAVMVLVPFVAVRAARPEVRSGHLDDDAGTVCDMPEG